MIGSVRLERAGDSAAIAVLRDDLRWEVNDLILATFIDALDLATPAADAVGWPGYAELLALAEAVGGVATFEAKTPDPDIRY